MWKLKYGSIEFYLDIFNGYNYVHPTINKKKVLVMGSVFLNHRNECIINLTELEAWIKGAELFEYKYCITVF